jgi:GT2 family glycosyltransferase
MKAPPASIAAIVKARLLPPPALAGMLEKLIERLPRRLLEVALRPGEGVAVVDEARGEYRSLGKVVDFGMDLAPASPQGGTFYLEAALARNSGSRVACIRVVLRPGCGAGFTIPISSNLGGTVREVFRLPPGVEALCWSPTAAPGFFSQSPLLIHRITRLEGGLRRLGRVVFDLWRFRGRTPANRAGLGWWVAIFNLEEAYRQSTQLRLNRWLGSDYAEFIASHDSLTRAEIRDMRRRVSRRAPQSPLQSPLQSPPQPLVSLVMHVEKPVEKLLREMLASVSSQIDPHWELLLAASMPASNLCLAILGAHWGRDHRIKIALVPPGTDPAAALNAALARAGGVFVARIHQHDVLPPHALAILAEELQFEPDADLLYSDEDRIDFAGKREDPHFKPDWNPELFLSGNYLSSLVLIRRARVLALGGYRTGFPGAENFDLLLRYLHDIPPARIRHIPRLLCHSRGPDRPRMRASTTTVQECPVDATSHESGKRALKDYFQGSATGVEDGPAPGFYKVTHPLPALLPLVSIIIPSRDQAGLLGKCVESIRKCTDYGNWEIWIVDNQSVDPAALHYLEKIQADPRIHVLRFDEAFNYSAMNNLAVAHSQGDILALLNNDVEVINSRWLTEMVRHASRPGTGAVGAKLLYSDGTVQHAGVILGLGGVAGHVHKFLGAGDPGYAHRAVLTQNLSAVTGACLVVRKSCYLEVGGLDSKDLAVSFNDIDFCLKLVAAGYRNVFTPQALLYHHESVSRGPDDSSEKRSRSVREFQLMKSRWGTGLQDDPAYNRNLSLECGDFALRNLGECRAVTHRLPSSEKIS